MFDQVTPSSSSVFGLTVFSYIIIDCSTEEGSSAKL